MHVFLYDKYSICACMLPTMPKGEIVGHFDYDCFVIMVFIVVNMILRIVSVIILIVMFGQGL